MKIKYLDKQILNCINKRAIANNYNRAVRQEYIDSLPEDLHFPITFCMLHEHAAGKPVAAHMRCMIMTAESLTGPFNNVFVDVEMGMFEMLPEAETSVPVGPQPSAN
jgi:hypothetical protein